MTLEWLLTELSVRLGCSSPDGSAELGQIDTLQQRYATAVEVGKSLDELRREAEARATAAERERDQRHAEALHLATGLRDIGLLLAPTCDGEPSDDELVIDRVRQLLAERDRLQRELEEQQRINHEHARIATS